MATKAKANAKCATPAMQRRYWQEMGFGPTGPGPLVPFFTEEESAAIRAKAAAKRAKQTKRSK